MVILPYWKYCNWQYVLKCSLESGKNERAQSIPSQVAPVGELGLGTRVASDIEVLHLHFTSGHRSKSTNQMRRAVKIYPIMWEFGIAPRDVTR